MTDLCEMFKSELRLIPKYEARIKELQSKKDELYYRLCGVSGISYDKAPTSFNPEISEAMKLELLDKIELIDKEIDSLNNFIKATKYKLKQIDKDIANAMFRIYCRGKSYESVANDNPNFWNTSALYRAIEQEILNYYKKF